MGVVGLLVLSDVWTRLVDPEMFTTALGNDNSNRMKQNNSIMTECNIINIMSRYNKYHKCHAISRTWDQFLIVKLVSLDIRSHRNLCSTLLNYRFNFITYQKEKNK